MAQAQSARARPAPKRVQRAARSESDAPGVNEALQQDARRRVQRAARSESDAPGVNGALQQDGLRREPRQRQFDLGASRNGDLQAGRSGDDQTHSQNVVRGMSDLAGMTERGNMGAELRISSGGVDHAADGGATDNRSIPQSGNLRSAIWESLPTKKKRAFCNLGTTSKRCASASVSEPKLARDALLTMPPAGRTADIASKNRRVLRSVSMPGSQVTIIREGRRTHQSSSNNVDAVDQVVFKADQSSAEVLEEVPRRVAHNAEYTGLFKGCAGMSSWKVQNEGDEFLLKSAASFHTPSREGHLVDQIQYGRRKYQQDYEASAYSLICSEDNHPVIADPSPWTHRPSSLEGGLETLQQGSAGFPSPRIQGPSGGCLTLVPVTQLFQNSFLTLLGRLAEAGKCTRRVQKLPQVQGCSRAVPGILWI